MNTGSRIDRGEYRLEIGQRSIQALGLPGVNTCSRTDRLNTGSRTDRVNAGSRTDKGEYKLLDQQGGIQALGQTEMNTCSWTARGEYMFKDGQG